MNIETIQIKVAIAVIGFAIANIPPIIEITPIAMLIALYPLEICLATPPTIILAIPVKIKDNPSNVTNITVVVSGLEITNAASAMVMAPKIISAIRIPFGVLST